MGPLLPISPPETPLLSCDSKRWKAKSYIARSLLWLQREIIISYRQFISIHLVTLNAALKMDICKQNGTMASWKNPTNWLLSTIMELFHKILISLGIRRKNLKCVPFCLLIKSIMPITFLTDCSTDL